MEIQITQLTKEKISNGIFYLFIIVFTGTVGYLTLGKGFDFDIYTGFSGDGIGAMATVKSIQENGFSGIWFNSRIGAPETSALIDYPGMGSIMVLILWFFSVFTGSTSRILYLYLITSFLLDGLSMSLLLRKLKINKMAAFVISSLFSFAPYHFYRYLGHITLVNYMFAPIAFYLCLYILDIIREERKWKIIFCTILLGLGYGYYYAFGLIMLAASYLIKFIRIENKKEIIKQLWVSGLLLITILGTLLPKMIYSAVNGANPFAGHRMFFEQEIYGLKIINLLLPVSYSRIKLFRNLTDAYCTSGAPAISENTFASLGLIGSLGFILLCMAFIISFTLKSKCSGKEWELVDFLSFETLVFILVGTVGGFGEIFNWAVTSQIRCYNRVSVFITGLSLIMIAILLNRTARKKKNLYMLLCITVLGVGCFDQINIGLANWQDEVRPVQEQYEAFFSEAENSLEKGAMVYQLPYWDYPEAGAEFDYKHFIGYLFTDHLRWSYGGVYGRNEAAKKLNIDNGMSYRFLAGIKKVGFQAVYIDLDGYTDTDIGERILEFYHSFGIQPIVSQDEKLYVYDISKLEVAKGWEEPGYTFVNMWADKHHADVSDEEKADLAKGLYQMDETAYLKLYHWIAADITVDKTDDEFIDYMYNAVLNRTESDGERRAWADGIRNGTSREDVFYMFLSSEEFRNGQGFTEEQ